MGNLMQTSLPPAAMYDFFVERSVVKGSGGGVGDGAGGVAFATGVSGVGTNRVGTMVVQHGDLTP